MDADDIFCVYCQKQYQRVTPFLKHVKKEHFGVYQVLREKDIYARYVGMIENENPF